MTTPTNTSSPATTAAGQADITASGDAESSSSLLPRRRAAKLRNFFRQPANTQLIYTQPASTQPTNTQPVNTQPAITQPANTHSANTQLAITQPVKTQPVKYEAKIQPIQDASTKAGDFDDSVDSSIKEVSDLEPGSQGSTEMSKARLDIFSENVSKPAASIEVPKHGSRIDSTPQLALCSGLLLRSQGVQDQDASHDTPTDQAQLDWISAIEEDIVEQHHIRCLGTRMVDEFSKDPAKDSAIISEVVLLGPVLDRKHHRKLLNCLISELENAKMLDVHLLQGLIQFVQCASEGYLVADDLIKILSILRVHLQDTHPLSTEHSYHLTLAVSRLLDVMAEHKVQDVKRVEEHAPLLGILSGLRSTSDPFLMYQAAYAYQALLYVLDNDTALQAVLRYSAGEADSVVKISSVVKMDLGFVLDGLKGIQEALSSTYDTAKTGYDGVHSLKESGRRALDSLKDGHSIGQKRLWYPALRAANGFVRQDQLADLNRLIVEAPCRRDPLFQWGICQLLGEVAADEAWGVATRQQAIDILEDLYSNDMEWAQDESIKGWMLDIIVQLGSTSDPAIKDHVNYVLDDLKKSGCSLTSNSHSHPLRSRLPMPESSPLLTRVQKLPEVEYDLHRLKRQRLEERNVAVYVPPMAKSRQQAPDSDVFPLMERVSKFLSSEQQVMLILGDAGAGKSTFNRHLECELWKEYKIDGCVPLFINMPTLSKPESELIEEQLQKLKFSEAQIGELKLHRQLIVICDGYDESQLTVNIHTANQLNQPGRWNVKLVVSCRSQYLGHDYRNQFVPQGTDHHSAPALRLFQEAVITPLSKSQIKDYVERYVPLEPLTWVTEDYMEKLTTIPNLMDLVTNPFLLMLALGALPSVVQGKEDLTTIRITRVALYDSFVEHWIGSNKRRLQKQKLEQNSQTVFAELIEDDFERHVLEFQKDLASAIFLKQDGKPVVDYTPSQDKSSWKAKFLSSEPEPTLLRECSLLSRVGIQYRFIHRSILEYFYSRSTHETNISDDQSSQTVGRGPDAATFVQPIGSYPLSKRDLPSEPLSMQALCKRVQESVVYKDYLLAIIEQSKTDPDASKAASNAITILVKAGVTFNGADLQGIRIPGADLSGGQFDSAQLQGADLKKTNLRNIWLRKADLSNALMEGVQFGEWPLLKEASGVNSCAYSLDGTMFAVGLDNGTISLYETATWEKANTLKHHTSVVTSVVFSPKGHRIASGSEDKTVRLWDAHTGTPCAILTGHTSEITSVVFSPSRQQIASGSDDKTVRLWDAQTGAPCAVLSGHSSGVTSVVFSPRGQQIASGSNDRTILLWDAQTGVLGVILEVHTFWVKSMAFAPSGQHLASGNSDGTVRLWDAQTSAGPSATSGGHTSGAKCVVFSPSGQQVASGSDDKTARPSNTQTGAPDTILNGQASDVTSVMFSSNGQQSASGSTDKTVRLWDAPTGESGAVSRQSSGVTSVVFSQSSEQIASGSNDRTIHLRNAQTGASEAIVKGHAFQVKSKILSPSDQYHASGSDDKTVRPRDSKISAPGAVVEGHTFWAKCVVFSPSGQHLASGNSDKTVRLWDAQTGAPGAILKGHTSDVLSVVFSPSGQQIASGSDDKTVRLWDTQTVAPDAIVNGHTSAVMSVIFSPNGQQIASGSTDKTVRLWDAQTGAPGAVLNGHTQCVRSVVFSPNGRQIASGSEDGTVRLWDAHTCAPGAVLSGHLSGVTSVVFSPRGQQIASASRDQTVRLWNAQTGASGAILSGHTDWVMSVAFSPNGRQIASCSGDCTVRLWDAQTGVPGAILNGHTDYIRSVVFSPSGKQIASSSWDKTVQLWDAQTGAAGAVLRGHTGCVQSVVFSPDGQQIASASEDKTMRLWDAVSGRCLTEVKEFYGSVRSVAWNAYRGGSYIATGCEDKSVRMWQVIGVHHLIHLRWSSTHDRLVASNTNIFNAQGLSETNTKLLLQGGAVSQPMSLKEP